MIRNINIKDLLDIEMPVVKRNRYASTILSFNDNADIQSECSNVNNDIPGITSC